MTKRMANLYQKKEGRSFCNKKRKKEDDEKK